MGAALVIVLFVLAGAAGIYFTYQAHKKRMAELTAFATRHGWTFTPGGDKTGLLESLHGTPFESGESRRVSNVITGDLEGRRVEVFDYSYVTRSTNSKGQTTTKTHPYKVAALGVGATFPRLEVTPENFVSRAVGKMMNSDINFEDEQFSRAFIVSCEDRKFAYDVVHPRMMEHLKASMSDATWKFDGQRIILFDDGHIKPEEIDAMLARLSAALDLVPDFVFKDRAGH